MSAPAPPDERLFLRVAFVNGGRLALLLVGSNGLVPSRHVGLLEMDFPHG
jgi:hypothetical protein